MLLKRLFALVFISCVALSYLAFPSRQELEIMTQQNAKNFAETLLDAYVQKVENYFRPEYREYFDFYRKSPFKIYATISNTHGAAIEFVPSDESLFAYKEVEQRIEEAIFPYIDLNITSVDAENATVLIWQGGEPGEACITIGGKGNMFSNMVFITNRRHFLDMETGGSLLLSNVNVDGIIYDMVIIKGDNSPESWTANVAEGEANRVFESDLFRAFNQSEEVREYIAYPTLKELIDQIVWKHHHAEEIGYDMLQYYEDLAVIRDIAVNTYHLDSTFVDEILNWIESKYQLEPKWWDVPPSSWFLGGIVGFSVTLILGLVGRRAYKRLKREWRSSKLKTTMHPSIV